MVVAIGALLASRADAQRRYGGYANTGYEPAVHNVPYDGRFTFARLARDCATARNAVLRPLPIFPKATAPHVDGVGSRACVGATWKQGERRWQ